MIETAPEDETGLTDDAAGFGASAIAIDVLGRTVFRDHGGIDVFSPSPGTTDAGRVAG